MSNLPGQGYRGWTLLVCLVWVGPLLAQEPKLRDVVLQDHEAGVMALAFSADGKLLASMSPDKDVLLWDTATWKMLARLSSFTGGNSNDGGMSVAFSPDGKYLAAPGLQGFKYWKVDAIPDGKKPVPFTLGVPENNIGGLGFTPEGQLVTGGGDGLRTWDLATRKVLTTPLKSSTGVSSFRSLTVSPDGKTLAFIDNLAAIQLWDLAKSESRGGQLWWGNGYPSRFAFSPDNKVLVAVGGVYDEIGQKWIEGKIHIIDVASGKVAETRKAPSANVVSVAFSPDGKTLATGHWDRTARLWDVAAWKEIATLKGHTGQVYAVAFSPDGKLLVTASSDQTIRLWDLPEKK